MRGGGEEAMPPVRVFEGAFLCVAEQVRRHKCLGCRAAEGAKDWLQSQPIINYKQYIQLLLFPVLKTENSIAFARDKA